MKRPVWSNEEIHELLVFDATREEIFAKRDEFLSYIAYLERPKYAKGISYNYYAGEVSFNCPCGETEIFLGEGGDEHECACGRVYRLNHYVTIVEKDMGE